MSCLPVSPAGKPLVSCGKPMTNLWACRVFFVAFLFERHAKQLQKTRVSQLKRHRFYWSFTVQTRVQGMALLWVSSGFSMGFVRLCNGFSVGFCLSTRGCPLRGRAVRLHPEPRSVSALRVSIPRPTAQGIGARRRRQHHYHCQGNARAGAPASQATPGCARPRPRLACARNAGDGYGPAARQGCCIGGPCGPV